MFTKKGYSSLIIKNLDKNNWGKWHIIIPARLHSTRLKEKLIQDLAGKPLIIRVYEAIKPLANNGACIHVATDSEKISKLLEKESIPFIDTDKNHQSGTDRIYEASKKLKDKREFILNIQGDEPFIDLEELEKLKLKMESDAELDITSAFFKNNKKSDFSSSNCVKVVLNGQGLALYFSRAMIPFPRDEKSFNHFKHHIGIYGFRTSSLKNFCQFSRGNLEAIESLEQLRALENGLKIGMVEFSKPTIGIDTEKDLNEARKNFK